MYSCVLRDSHSKQLLLTSTALTGWSVWWRRSVVTVSKKLNFLNRSMFERRTALFWVITQRVVVIPYRRFGTTYRSHLQGSRVKNSLPLRREVDGICALVENYAAYSSSLLQTFRVSLSASSSGFPPWTWDRQADPKRPQTITTTRCAKAQINADLIYFATEVSDHTYFWKG